MKLAATALSTALMVGQASASELPHNLIAQASSNYGSSSAPPQAPSFLKQAGQMLLENAQKRVINNMNQNLQNQQNLQSQPNSSYPAQNYQDPSYPASPYQQAPSQYQQSPSQFQQSPSQYQQTQSQYQQAPSQYIPGAQGMGAPYGSSTTSSSTTSADRKQSAPCRSWVKPGEKPLAVLLCIHGLGLQSNSYEYFGKEQSNRGLAVYAIDVRGFGSWMNAKGKTKVNFDECLEDIKQTLESIRAANPGLPVYILGESMGGAIALRAASMYPDLVDGLISSVPAGERFNQGKTSVKVFLNLLTGMNLANVGNDVLNQATKNQRLKDQWKDDPLARLNLSPQELIQFQDFMNFNHDAAKKVTDMPVLFVQGTGDQLVKPEGTWELFNDVASKDKSFFAVPGEHLIFEEAQTQDAGPRDQNFRVISSWLSTKVGRRYRGRGPLAGMRGGAGRLAASINTQGLESEALMVDGGQYGQAITALEQIRTQKPTDPNVLSLLGKAYLQSGAPEKAGPLFRSAMRIRRGGGDQAQAFNSYLLSMSGPQSGGASGASNAGYSSAGSGVVAGAANASSALAGGSQPATGFASPFDKLNSLFGLATSATAPNVGTMGKAKVYAFYANWAEQCKAMDNSLSRLGATFGDRVEIQRVNIEDAANDRLADQFKIGPIPTVVFVGPSGHVSQTIIGESTYNNYAQALDAATRM